MNKSLFSLLVALLLTANLNAQLLGSLDIDPKRFSMQSTSDSLLIKAIDGSVVVVRQAYQVKHKKNGKTYGRNGRTDFGHSYSLGVKSDAGLVLTDGALKPWIFDSAFSKIENDYEPVISLTEVRVVEQANSSKFAQCPLQLSRQQPDGAWIANVKDAVCGSMELDTQEGIKGGWIVWISCKKDLDDDPEATFKIATVAKTVENANSNDVIDVETTANDDNLIGGLFVTPCYLGGGHVTFRLTGMIVKVDDKWKLKTPFIGYTVERATQEPEKQPESVQSEQKQEENEEVELTPIGGDNKKKNKKQ